MDILKPNELPSWLHHYPPEYLCLVRQNIVQFRPWYLLDARLTKLRNEGLTKRYSDRQLFAFAARFDNDDIACWENKKLGQIVVIHDFASTEFAGKKDFSSFWNWFRAAIEEMMAIDECVDRVV
jgi:hypothetical protein